MAYKKIKLTGFGRKRKQQEKDKAVIKLLSTWFDHTFSSPGSAKSFRGPNALSPGTILAQSCFWARQDLAGQTLTRPFHARPRKCHLAGVNDYHSNSQVTCSQQEPRSLHLSASHFPCPLFISLQVNYSSCSTRRHKSAAQTP